MHLCSVSDWHITGYRCNERTKRDNISGNIDLTYRLKKFQFMNKFDMNNTDSKDPIVAFSQYADANPYYTKYNENGEVERWLEYTDLKFRK